MTKKPRYVCTRCGANEIVARREGCDYSPCPMELASPIRRFFLYKLGIMLP